MTKYRFQRIRNDGNGNYSVEYLCRFKWIPYYVEDKYYGNMKITFPTSSEAVQFAEMHMKGSFSIITSIEY